MWETLKKKLGLASGPRSKSSEVEFRASDSAELKNLPAFWKEPWVMASTEALKLLTLAEPRIKELPAKASFELPAEYQGFVGEIEHEVMLNGWHVITVAIKPPSLVNGISGIAARFEVTHEGEKLAQALPMWSGPNSEGFVWWVHGYEPQRKTANKRLWRQPSE
jgi:hypothetical protein